jgi:hypothetical protein
LGCHSFASSLWFFLPSVAPASQQEFSFMDLMLSTSSSSCHLGSLSYFLRSGTSTIRSTTIIICSFNH